MGRARGAAAPGASPSAASPGARKGTAKSGGGGRGGAAGTSPAAAGGGTAAAAPPPSFPPVWVTWVEGVTYLCDNVWDKRVPKEVVARFRPPASGRASACAPLSAAQARSANVRAGRITDPAHPAFGARWRTRRRMVGGRGRVCAFALFSLLSRTRFVVIHLVNADTFAATWRCGARAGQCGLFAARKLAPGEYVCDYRARLAARAIPQRTHARTHAWPPCGVGE
jgi:hypothetical protein